MSRSDDEATSVRSSLFPFRLLWLGRPWRWGLWARGLFDIGPVRLDWRQ